MPIFLTLSYLLSIWMLIDAYQRGEKAWWMVIILFPLGEFIYFFAVKIHDFDSGGGFSLGGERRKCADCEYCVQLYRNGSRCQIHNDPVFKTPIEIEYCASYKPVRRE